MMFRYKLYNKLFSNSKYIIYRYMKYNKYYYTITKIYKINGNWLYKENSYDFKEIDFLYTVL